LNPPKDFADRVDQILHLKIDPQQKKLERIHGRHQQKSSSKPYDSMDSLLLRFAKWRKGSSRGKFPSVQLDGCSQSAGVGLQHSRTCSMGAVHCCKGRGGGGGKARKCNVQPDTARCCRGCCAERLPVQSEDHSINHHYHQNDQKANISVYKVGVDLIIFSRARRLDEIITILFPAVNFVQASVNPHHHYFPSSLCISRGIRALQEMGETHQNMTYK
jgi:hypothetical protein